MAAHDPPRAQKPGRHPTHGGTRPTSRPEAGCLRTRWKGQPPGPDHVRHSRRADPRRPQGYAGWSRCPQVGPAPWPASRRSGTLDPCGSCSRRRGSLSSRPQPCRRPQRGPPRGLGGQQRPQRRQHLQRQRQHQQQRGPPAPKGLPEPTPALHLTGVSSGRWPLDRRSSVSTNSRGPSGHPGTEASTYRPLSARWWSARATASCPSQA